MKKHIKILKKKLKIYNPKLNEECGVFGISNNDDNKNVYESMMNAKSVPQILTTIPPSIAPTQSAVDQDALSIALAVIKSSSSTIFGSAALSAVT